MSASRKTLRRQILPALDENLRFDMPSIVAAAAFLLCFGLMIYTDKGFIGTPDSTRDKGRLLGVLPMQLVVVLPAILIIPYYARVLWGILKKPHTLVGIALVVFGFIVGLVQGQPLAGIAYDIRVCGWFFAGVILASGVRNFRFEGAVYIVCLGAAACLSWLVLKNSVMLISDADEVRQTDHMFAQYTEMIFPLVVYGLVRYSERNVLVWLAFFGIYGVMFWLVGAVAITRTYVLQAACGLFLFGLTSFSRLTSGALPARGALMVRGLCAAAMFFFGLIIGYAKVAEKVQSFILRSKTAESSNSALLRWMEFQNNFEFMSGPDLLIGNGLGCQFLNLHGYTWPFLHLGIFVPLFKFGLAVFAVWLIFGPARAGLRYLRLLTARERRFVFDQRLATLSAFFTWFVGSCMSGGMSEYAFIALGIIYGQHVLAPPTEAKAAELRRSAPKTRLMGLTSNAPA
jgi:hypothetical protein